MAGTAIMFHLHTAISLVRGGNLARQVISASQVGVGCASAPVRSLWTHCLGREHDLPYRSICVILSYVCGDYTFLISAYL